MVRDFIAILACIFGALLVLAVVIPILILVGSIIYILVNVLVTFF